MVKNTSNKQKPRFIKAIIVLTVITMISKLTLIGLGLFANMDEGKYREAEEVFQGIKEGDMTRAMTHLFSTEPPQARPGYTLAMTLLESAYQGLRQIRDFTHSKFDIEYDNISRGQLIFLFNYITLTCILILLWRLSFLLSKSRTIAWFTVLIFASSLYSSIYLRHALPYNLALLINLIVSINLMGKTTDSRNRLHFLLAGVLTGVSFTIYPGYILLSSVIFLSYLLFKQPFLMSSKHVFISAIGFFLVIGITESIALYTTGVSYLLDSKSLSTTITQGNPRENLSFIGVYLLNSGPALGVLIGLIISLAIVKTAIQLWKQESLDKTQILGIATLMVLIGYGTVGIISGSLVYYGRLVYQFLPLLILIGFSAVIKLWRGYSMRRPLAFFISVMLICGYSSFVSIAELNQIGYSNDFVEELILSAKEEGRKIYYAYETRPIYTAEPLIAIDSITLLKNPSLVIVNASFFYQRSWKSVVSRNIHSEFPALNYTESVKHYQLHTGYMMENNSSEMHDFLSQWNPELYAIRVN